jgi:DNA-binding NarL/FixJ family response regulator
MSKLIRVLVADDHAVVRQGLSSVITPSDGMEVVGEAVNGVETVEMARNLKPDVILIDLVMPEKNGLDAIREIKQDNQAARILVLTSFGDDSRVSEAIQSGALGFILKDSSGVHTQRFFDRRPVPCTQRSVRRKFVPPSRDRAEACSRHRAAAINRHGRYQSNGTRTRSSETDRP